MREMFSQDPGRFGKFSLQVGNLLLDYSKNIITSDTMELLMNLARQNKLEDWIARMFRGEKINNSEQRAALHTALRTPRNSSIYIDGRDVVQDVHHVLDHIRHFSEAVRNGRILGHTKKHSGA